MCLLNLNCHGIRNCKWNPLIVSRIRIHLRNLLTFAESGTNTYIRSLQNRHQNQCADKVNVTAICTRNPQKFCKRNPHKFLLNPFTFAESAYICGIRNNYLYSLVANFSSKSMCRQNLRYRYLYAESTEIL